MRDTQTYELNSEHRKRQRQFADTYRLSQTIEEHNKFKNTWRSLFKSFNRNR